MHFLVLKKTCNRYEGIILKLEALKKSMQIVPINKSKKFPEQKEISPDLNSLVDVQVVAAWLYQFDFNYEFLVEKSSSPIESISQNLQDIDFEEKDVSRILLRVKEETDDWRLKSDENPSVYARDLLSELNKLESLIIYFTFLDQKTGGSSRYKKIISQLQNAKNSFKDAQKIEETISELKKEKNSLKNTKKIQEVVFQLENVKNFLMNCDLSGSHGQLAEEVNEDIKNLQSKLQSLSTMPDVLDSSSQYSLTDSRFGVESLEEEKSFNNRQESANSSSPPRTRPASIEVRSRGASMENIREAIRSLSTRFSNSAFSPDPPQEGIDSRDFHDLSSLLNPSVSEKCLDSKEVQSSLESNDFSDHSQQQEKAFSFGWGFRSTHPGT